jgi:hypothetical protein
VPWVAASGVKGLDRVTITLAPGAKAERRYTVRLHFTEPEAVAHGERVFDVLLQGRRVLEGLDIAKETGGAYRGLVKEFHGIAVGENLVLQFSMADGSKRRPLICGIEVVAEGW